MTWKHATFNFLLTGMVFIIALLFTFKLMNNLSVKRVIK
jgi:hypothetical protein